MCADQKSAGTSALNVLIPTTVTKLYGHKVLNEMHGNVQVQTLEIDVVRQ